MASQPPQPSQSFWERVQPWNCPGCGWRRISANQQQCPRCKAYRPGVTSPAELQATQDAATGQATRVYEGEQAMQAGIAAMAHDGWRVVSQSSFQPQSGVGRTVALGFVGALFIKPPIKFTVIFTREPVTP